MSKNKMLYVGLIVTVIALIIIGIVVSGKGSQKAEAPEGSLVRTAIVKLTGTADNYIYSGKVRGRYESQLAFQVNGKIIKRNIELGSLVRAGQILMQIDPIDIEQAVNSASTQVTSAQSQFQLAKDNLERFQKLYNDHLISKAEFDNYLNAYEMASAGLNQARIQYKDATNKYNYCTLYANTSGVIAGINAEVGQVIGAGQPVVTLVKAGELEVEINVPENRLAEIRNASQLKITFWALPEVSVSGQVREVAPMADPISSTYRMRIKLVNPPAELELGMTATVTLADADQAKTIYVPLTAIIQTGKKPAVWVVKDEKVYLRIIQVGSFGDDQVQVVAGLNEGERVVTAGVHTLRDGQKVRVGDDI